MWLRLLSLVFGVTVYAASTVLAGFMAGLGRRQLRRRAAGLQHSRGRSSRSGRRSARRHHRARVTPMSSPRVTAAMGLDSSCAAGIDLARHRHSLRRRVPGPDRADVADGRHAAARRQVGGRARGRASADASACCTPSTPTGAIAGALIAGFYLISEVGVDAIVSHRRRDEPADRRRGDCRPVTRLPRSDREADACPARTPGTHGDRRRRRHEVSSELVLWTFFLSGVMSLALEIIWFRMLVVFLRPDRLRVHDHARRRAGRHRHRQRDRRAAPALRAPKWLPVLAGIQAAIGCTAVLSFNVLAQSPGSDRSWRRRGSSWLGFNTYLGAARRLEPDRHAADDAAARAGVSDRPDAVGRRRRAATRRAAGSARSIRSTCSARSLGSVLAGFILLPRLGARAKPDRGRRRWPRSRASCSPLLGTARPSRRWRRAMAVFAPVLSSDWRASTSRRSVRHRVRALPSPRNAGLARRRRADHGGRARSSDRQSADAGDVSRRQPSGQRFARDGAFVHHRIGALPVMLHPAPDDRRWCRARRRRHARRGGTPRHLHVDVVELSKAVVDGSDLLHAHQLRPAEAPQRAPACRRRAQLPADDAARSTTSSPPTSSCRGMPAPARCIRASTTSWCATRWPLAAS